MLTKAMQERIDSRAGVIWETKDDKYYIGIGHGPLGFELIYIAVPEDHPDVGKHYDDLNIDVNGGLTFSVDNVFGWDYGHAFNNDDYDGDIQNALKFFKERESKENAK